MTVQTLSPEEAKTTQRTDRHQFPLNMWYVAAHSKELSDKPLARILLNEPIVFFRTEDGSAHALEDRCCHRFLPLSQGTVEADGIRCGYHGLLFNGEGKCTEIPGQVKIPSKAKVARYHIIEQDSLIWIWFGADMKSEPTVEPPRYDVHSSGKYIFDGDVYHYNAPYQLVHDNLLDLSHLGYVHLKTIGGNAKIHMNAEMKVEQIDDEVIVTRHMLNSIPPPTYTAAFPFTDKVDRWQEIHFTPSHLKIWTGAVDHNSDSVTDPKRGGLHMRGFHGITPETTDTCFYLWTMASNPQTNPEETMKVIIQQTADTFDEDKVVIEAQYENIKRFPDQRMIDIHIDVGPNRARRIIEQLKQTA